ncbi:MAG: SixA phosphatase family protein [Thermocrispum sp.]
MVDRRLTVLRHAKSDWPAGVPDFDRPLAARGRSDAPAAGRWLSGQVPPALVLCSPAVRARQTCELVVAELADQPRVRVDERLYAASTGDLLAVVQGLDDAQRHVVLIAHNPGLSTLATVLTGERLELKTSGIAVAGWTGSWAAAAPNAARLLAVATARG